MSPPALRAGSSDTGTLPVAFPEPSPFPAARQGLLWPLVTPAWVTDTWVPGSCQDKGTAALQTATTQIEPKLGLVLALTGVSLC